MDFDEFLMERVYYVVDLCISWEINVPVSHSEAETRVGFGYIPKQEVDLVLLFELNSNGKRNAEQSILINIYRV